MCASTVFASGLPSTRLPSFAFQGFAWMPRAFAASIVRVIEPCARYVS
jgi:hypothetical protein